MAGMPAIVRTLPESAAALLIEFQESTQQELESRVAKFLESSSALSLLNAPVFTTDPIEQDFLWRVRKGLFPAVGAVRASGTTVILEDVAFPVQKLGDAILDLQALFQKYGYLNAIIFGHAKDGNIHFVVTQSFNTEQEVIRYDRFIRDVVSLVVEKYEGTLKAEHGTGRNMAPFVETEWGGEAYEIIKKIKEVSDPTNLLNPGVIVNEDKNAHIRSLKELPTVEEEVDRCIECGYCEHKCPSRDLTTTPRRRIVIRRVLKSHQLSGEKDKYKLLLNQYQYDGIETCAVDGLCAIACPVDINTGDLIKRLRYENHSATSGRLALWTAKNFKTVEMLTRFALRTGQTLNNIFGKLTMTKITRGLKSYIHDFPLWTNQIPPPADLSILERRRNLDGDLSIVYFPACISRTMGVYDGKQKNLVETFMSICAKANVNVVVLNDYMGSCCGQIFSSKGFKEAYVFTANKIVQQLWASSQEGKLPVVIDVSSCAYTLRQLRSALNNENKINFDLLQILDSVDFLHDVILQRVNTVIKKKRVVLHPVCSLQKMGTEGKFLRIAKHFSAVVDVPAKAGCCGMAGDRGFLFPELTHSATAAEATEILGTYEGYYSTTKTCEMAMSVAVKQNYESILYLVDEGLDNKI
jgi:D-lactate dehydrogenase